MRKTLLIALMTGSLALGAVSTYAIDPREISGQGEIVEREKSKEEIERGSQQHYEKSQPSQWKIIREEGKQEDKPIMPALGNK